MMSMGYGAACDVETIRMSGEGERFVTTAQDDAHVVVLSLIHRIEFCEQDIFDKVMPYDMVIPTEAVPRLSMHPLRSNACSAICSPFRS